MKKGKLYGVGVGPGDRELLTLKALRVLKEADIIAAPVMANGAGTAREIIEEYIKGREVIEFPMPMTKNLDKLEKNYSAIADRIEEHLSAGETVVFITLGDVTIYSAYMQIDRIIRARGYETELVPGITSFSAAAARLNIALCERDEPLIILPASYDVTDEMLDMRGTKVLMKANRRTGAVCDMIKKKGLAKDAVMVECCGMANERIYTSLDDISDDSSYFSIIIVR